MDVGTDVFAFRDDREDVARVQVKAAQGKPYQNGGGYWAQFNIPIKQLEATDKPLLYYALAVRLEDQWVSFLVIGRTQLREFREGERPFGIENGRSGELALRISYRPAARNNEGMTVRCGDVELKNFLDAWNQLPPLWPLPDVPATEEPHGA